MVIGSESYSYVIPILRLPGRAGMDFVLNLYYNSRIWDIDTVNGTVTFNADRDFPSYGFRLDYGYLESADSSYILTEGDGTKRILAQGTDPAKPFMYYSTDGSHIQYNASTAIISYKNGVTAQYLRFPSTPLLLRPVWIKDSNGNYFGIAYVAGHDQLIYNISGSMGRVITFNYDSSNRLTSLSQFVHPSGSKTYITFTWGSPYSSGHTWYNYAGLAVNGAPAAGQIHVVTGCTYPNGTGYRFTYGDWGIITKIESLSSTGATRSYASYDVPLASQSVLTDAPTYTHQTISPDGGTSSNSVWTYATTKSGIGVVTSMAITDPNGTTSTTTLDPNTGLISSIQTKDSSNAPQRTASYTWATTGFPPVSTILASILTTLNDTGQQSKVAFGYDPWANVTDVYEYDFGPTLKRHTVTSYLTTGDYVTFHVVNRPTQILVKDAADSIMARTDMTYDDTPLTSVTGAANHDDTSYSASFTTRGNLTKVTRYANAATGTGATTRSSYYDSLGNLTSTQLGCCNQKTFSFSSTTQYSFPDSITSGSGGGPQFTSGFTFDPDSSLLLSSTEENGQTTQYQYDSMGRTTQVTLPPQSGTQAQNNTAYGDDTVSPTVTSSSTANSAVSVTTLDGLGHVMEVDNKNGNALVSSVKYAYDKLWQRTQASNPFSPAETVLYTNFTYDALGRATRVTPPSAGYTQYTYSSNTVTITDPAGKQHKNYVDALGRLIQVDEPGNTFAGTPVSGTLTITGTLRGQTGSGTPASGSVTIAGAEMSTEVDPCQDIEPPRPCPHTVWDSGSVSVTVNGHTNSVSYGSFSTSSSIASGLASAINGDAGASVTASASSSVVTLTAKATGAAGNSYALSASSATGDVYDFGGPSFTASRSGVTLSGGVAGTASYDSGTVNVTVGGFTSSAPYSQSGNSTAALVATALVGTGPSGLNRPGSPLHASANGSAITLTYNAVGATRTDVLAAASSSTNDPTHFPGGSFNGSNTLTDGQNPYAPGLAHPYSTTYTYDVMNNLTAVFQAAGIVNGQSVSGQPRSFAYDSMGRLLTATTPESGTVTNYYTNASGGTCAVDASLVCRVQDAMGVIKTYSYDGINRPAGVQYSDGTPSVTYTYDTGGAAAFALNRLTKITEGPTNSQTFTHDNFGRITAVSHVIDSTTYVTQYSYNLASQLTAITYPTGRVVAQNVDGIGRLSSIVSGSTTYLGGLSYNAAGEALGLTLGNGVQGALGYNDHSQLASLRYSKSGNSMDILNLGYDYGTNNNGQIQAVRYYTSPGVEDATKSEYFNYDPWLRLSTAHTGVVNSIAGTWSMSWAYDRLGNRLSQVLTGGNISVTQPNFVVDPTTNHITSYSYDAAGNVTSDGVYTYYYDGANRLKQFNGTETYTYFGQLRVKKATGSDTTVYIYSGGKPIVEYLNGALSAENIYDGSRLLAVITPTNTIYYHADHLSTRAQTDATGVVVRSSGTLPFGETWYVVGNSAKWKFTSYERDSLLDYAQFRYYASIQGRFMSADLLGGNLGEPQSLNRYAYAGNDPINAIDPTGLLHGRLECLLDDRGDCVGGNGYNPGQGGWGDDHLDSYHIFSDPFGPWSFATQWDPLGDAEAAYDKQVTQAKFNQIMEKYGVNELVTVTDRGGIVQVFTPISTFVFPNLTLYLVNFGTVIVPRDSLTLYPAKDSNGYFR